MPRQALKVNSVFHRSASNVVCLGRFDQACSFRSAMASPAFTTGLGHEAFSSCVRSDGPSETVASKQMTRFVRPYGAERFSISNVAK
jgi:hypothetical protein